MAEIKPAEISAILRKQVEGFESGATLGSRTVLQVGDGIARIYGFLMFNTELVEFDNGLEAIVES
jgi:F-type H+-transporting ATPase subunit alpha